MHWAAWIWTAVLLLLGLAGVADDLVSKHAWYRTLISAAVGILCPAFVAHFHDVIELPVPKLLVAFAAVATALEIRWVFRETRNEPDYSPKVLYTALAILGALYGPALVLGWIGPG